MKQHINKQQWYELDEDQKDIFINNPLQANPDLDSVKFPNIGQMIEYLGEDLDDITRVVTNLKLCDALWKACVYKLNLK